MLNQARIFHKKPDLKHLRIKEYTAFDMHVHTNHSDGTLSVAELIETACRQGIGLCITDHNEIKGVLEAEKNKSGVDIIPGIEVTPSEGMHLLFYFFETKELKEFFNKHVRPYKNPKAPCSFLDRSALDVINDSKPYDCIISAAHPYSLSWSGLMKHKESMKIFNKIEAVEVINGTATKGMNKNSIKIALKGNKCYTGGSDCHFSNELGQAISYVRKRCTREEFLDLVRRKKNFVKGHESSMLQKAKHLTISNSGRCHPFEYLKKYSKFLYKKSLD